MLASIKAFFAPRSIKAKLDYSTNQLLNLEVQKKTLEMEKEQIALELQNLRKKSDMAVEEQLHKHKLKLEEEKSVFSREKKIWEAEKQELKDRADRERKEFEDSLKRESDLKIQEAVTLTKLDSQQKIKQSELNSQREINDLKTKHAEELSQVKSKSAEEFYAKLTDAYQEIQMHGDKNSKFVQELALKVFDKMPASTTRVDVDVDSTPRLVSPTSKD